MAAAGLSAYLVNMIHPMEAIGYLAPAGFRLVFQAAILMVAVVAARRYQLSGLWILVAAAFVAFFQDVMSLVSSASLAAGNDGSLNSFAWLQYVHLVTMALVFCGWCVLAFSHKQGAKRL